MRLNRTTYPYSTHTYLIQYNTFNFRIIRNIYQKEKGWELSQKIGVHFDNITDTEEISRISLTRTKSRIRELALCNKFEYFGTLTINSEYYDRYDLNIVQNALKQKLKAIQRKKTNKIKNYFYDIKDEEVQKLKYIIITEKHKDGAFHFHGLFSGIDLEKNENGYLYSPELSSLGFNSFSEIRDYNKTCNYILKYITKDCVRNSHNQIFMRSKGLNVATHEEIDNSIEPNWKFENDFCKIYDLDLTNLSDSDKKLIADIYNLNKKNFYCDKTEEERGIFTPLQSFVQRKES